LISFIFSLRTLPLSHSGSPGCKIFSAVVKT
jgi:hypothetical protein